MASLTTMGLSQVMSDPAHQITAASQQSCSEKPIIAWPHWGWGCSLSSLLWLVASYSTDKINPIYSELNSRLEEQNQAIQEHPACPVLWDAFQIIYSPIIWTGFCGEWSLSHGNATLASSGWQRKPKKFSEIGSTCLWMPPLLEERIPKIPKKVL